MAIKGSFILLVFFIVHNTMSLPINMQSPLSNFNQQLLCEASATPVITEIVPSLQFGEITVSGDLPIGGSILVKGCFPVYGTVAVEGGLPSYGTAVVNTGGGLVAQLV